jgi:hypothetical protein
MRDTEQKTGELDATMAKRMPITDESKVRLRESVVKKRIFALILAVVMTLSLAACNGGQTDGGESGNAGVQGAATQEDQQAGAATDIGQGQTVFTFEVTDNTGAIKTFNVHTDEQTVGAALLAAGIIDGEDSSYGLMVTEVNGLKADYDADGAYWAFYVDGEYALSGVDSTSIESGKSYAFVYTRD